jgi:hypothetical protein
VAENMALAGSALSLSPSPLATWLAQRCISAACAAFRICHQLRLLLLLRFYCRLHELSNKQQEAGSRYISG